MRTVTDEEVYNIIKTNYIRNNVKYPKKPLHVGLNNDCIVQGYLTRLRLDHMDLRNVEFDSIEYRIENDEDILSLLDYSNLINPLCGCDFEGSNLSGLDCTGIDFRFCNFKDADLRNCDFTDANFSWSNMKDVLIDNAVFKSCDLSWTNMESISTNGADFTDADLSKTRNPPDLPMVCPKKGEFIAYKICVVDIHRVSGYECVPVLVKLLIPEHAKRSSGTTLSCRSSEAQVLDFEFPNGYDDLIEYKKFIKVKSSFASDFIYEIGKTVTSKYGFYDNRYQECAPGIHFYINREDAKSSLKFDYFYSIPGFSRIFTFA